MKLLIISSSQRAKSQSLKVGQYLSSVASQYDQVTHIDLNQIQLPLWSGDERNKRNCPSWTSVELKLATADAIMLITPEWGGMASPLLKNFLLMCEEKTTAHKPVLIVAVSSGIGGVNPVAELRMNAFKNNKFLPIPDHLIIRNVVEVLNKDTDLKSLSTRDSELRERIDFSLNRLHHYAVALKKMRQIIFEVPYPNQEKFIYGM